MATYSKVTNKIRTADNEALDIRAGIPLRGNDDIRGSMLNDYIDAGSGNDFVFGRGGDDNVRGGMGNDYVNGGTGNDYVHGNAGDDALVGYYGNDTLDGGAGFDTVFISDFGPAGVSVTKQADDSFKVVSREGTDILRGVESLIIGSIDPLTADIGLPYSNSQPGVVIHGSFDLGNWRHDVGTTITVVGVDISESAGATFGAPGGA